MIILEALLACKYLFKVIYLLINGTNAVLHAFKMSHKLVRKYLFKENIKGKGTMYMGIVLLCIMLTFKKFFYLNFRHKHSQFTEHQMNRDAFSLTLS